MAEIAGLEAAALPSLLAHLAALQAAVAARLAEVQPERAVGASAEDRLLHVDEAAALLGVSRDFMYCSTTLRSLRVKVGARVLFSHRKIQTFIERHAGR